MINNSNSNNEQRDKVYIILPHPTNEYRKIKPFLKKNNLPLTTEAKYAAALVKIGLPNGGRLNVDRLPLLKAVLRT